MKITADFGQLWVNVRRMSEGKVELDLSDRVVEDFEIDQELSSTIGLDITLDDLNTDNGVLSVKGRQVLLFIPDQDSKIDEVLTGKGNVGKKYHVADCQTLETMRNRNRFGRYKATYNVSGQFGVYGISLESGKSREGEAELKVCKNCLKYLNYRGYNQGVKRIIFDEFDIGKFLSTYSTLFRSMPKRGVFEEKGGYSDDWQKVSESYRSTVSYCCETCSVDLKEHRRLLHTHHISGNKRDNSSSNLSALCIDCHRKQPFHGSMYIKHEDMKQLNRLRKRQGLLNIDDWTGTRNMADQTFDGLLRHYEATGTSIPEVGYQLMGQDDSVCSELDIAWPRRKTGIAINKSDFDAATIAGWKVISVGNAYKKMNK